MASMAKPLRRVAGLLASLVLVVLAMGPTLDALVCGPEIEPQAAASAKAHALGVTLAATVTSPDSHNTGPADHGAASCIHGHCHHAQVIPATEARVATLTALDVVNEAMPGRIPASTEPPGLKRPPRA